MLRIRKRHGNFLATDRGGLYLDSKPGVYSDVIELDFASLFPSIIATRNISPETLNCACCQTTTEFPTTEMFVPLSPDEAEKVFRERERRGRFFIQNFPFCKCFCTTSSRTENAYLCSDSWFSWKGCCPNNRKKDAVEGREKERAICSIYSKTRSNGY